MGLPQDRFNDNRSLCKAESVIVVGRGTRGEVLKCQSCNKTFAATNTKCIHQHADGKKHQKNLPIWKKNKEKQAHLNLQGGLEKPLTATQVAVKRVNKETLEMLAFTGTPIYLVSKPEFRDYAKNNISFGGHIKRADHLMTDHLPGVMEDHETALMKMLHNVGEDGLVPYYSLVIDEQSDKYVQYCYCFIEYGLFM